MKIGEVRVGFATLRDPYKKIKEKWRLINVPTVAKPRSFNISSTQTIIRENYTIQSLHLTSNYKILFSPDTRRS